MAVKLESSRESRVSNSVDQSVVQLSMLIKYGKYTFSIGPFSYEWSVRSGLDLTSVSRGWVLNSEDSQQGPSCTVPFSLLPHFLS
jgi:hypothetical protein